MPELPEVETVRRALQSWLPGRVVADAEAHPSTKFLPALEVVGSRFGSVGRRGKFLLIGLDGRRELIVHLGMTGVLRPTHETGDVDPYVRARWRFEDGGGLELRDVRRFGRIEVVTAGDYTGTLASMGPEPFDASFTPASLHAALARSRRPIKTQLLSQRPVAGVGNIYADEALWSAGIHPARTTLSRPRAERLAHALREVLQDGIDHGGTTLRDYRSVDGSEGGHQHHLACYGRAGLPCDRCGSILRRMVLDGRSTTYCASCQH